MIYFNFLLSAVKFVAVLSTNASIVIEFVTSQPAIDFEQQQ